MSHHHGLVSVDAVGHGTQRFPVKVAFDLACDHNLIPILHEDQTFGGNIKVVKMRCVDGNLLYIARFVGLHFITRIFGLQPSFNGLIPSKDFLVTAVWLLPLDGRRQQNKEVSEKHVLYAGLEYEAVGDEEVQVIRAKGQSKSKLFGTTARKR